MLARMSAQQGRFSQAEVLWQRALQLDPSNESYLAGLRRIAQSRSHSSWGAMAIVFGAAVFILLLVWVSGWIVESRFGRLQEAFRGDMARLALNLRREAQSRAPTTEERAVSQSVLAPLETKNPAVTKTHLVPPRIALDTSGATIRAEKNELVITFQEGLFLAGADLTLKARESLSALGV